MKKRKLKRWVEYLLMTVSTLIIIALVSINDFDSFIAYILAWIVGMSIVVINHKILSKYGKIYNED